MTFLLWSISTIHRPNRCGQSKLTFILRFSMNAWGLDWNTVDSYIQRSNERNCFIKKIGKKIQVKWMDVNRRRACDYLEWQRQCHLSGSQSSLGRESKEQWARHHSGPECLQEEHGWFWSAWPGPSSSLWWLPGTLCSCGEGSCWGGGRYLPAGTQENLLKPVTQRVSFGAFRKIVWMSG